MRPYFANPERVSALHAELRSWEGTRFWPACGARAKKGVGVDCVTFVEKVLVNVGALAPITWPPYVAMGGGVAMLDLIIQTITEIPNVQTIWRPCDGGKPSLIPGDFIIRSIGEDFHHLAIYEGDKHLWHCRDRRGVCRANYLDRFAIRDLKRLYRVYERAT